MVFDIEDVVLEAMTVTSLALQHQVRHKLHLDRNHASTLTLLTTAPLRVEGEILWSEAHLLGQRLFGIEITDGIVSLHIRGRIGSRGLTDRVLVNELHPFDCLDVALEGDVFTGWVTDLAQTSFQGRIKNALDQTRLA
jgi:hypothetical protein